MLSFAGTVSENSEKIEAVKNNTMETDDQSSDVADRVKEIRENIDTNLRPKLDEMTDFELDGIVKANASGTFHHSRN